MFTPLMLVLAVIEISGEQRHRRIAGRPARPWQDLSTSCQRMYMILHAGERDICTRVRLASRALTSCARDALADVIFAVDSIPAVFGVTLDPFIIYTSNIFAILSLRSLYGFVADVMEDLHYLNKVSVW